MSPYLCYTILADEKFCYRAQNLLIPKPFESLQILQRKFQRVNQLSGGKPKYFVPIGSRLPLPPYPVTAQSRCSKVECAHESTVHSCPGPTQRQRGGETVEENSTAEKHQHEMTERNKIDDKLLNRAVLEPSPGSDLLQSFRDAFPNQIMQKN